MLKKIINILPSYPHFKMNIFSGTNSLDEIKKTYRNLNSKNIVKGDDLAVYQETLKQRLNTSFVYTFASGRMGFYSILKVIGIKAYDEVIIPSYTCVVVPNAVLYSGAKPIYCDINANDYNIDVSKIEALITLKTKVLYAQHTFGQMCNVKAIVELANKYNLIVIEDVALALGAKIGAKYAGTIGDFGYFSTDRSKVINTGLGGGVILNNEKYKHNFDDFYGNVSHLSKAYTQKIANTFLINAFILHPSFYWLGKFLGAVLSKVGMLTYFLDEPFHDFDKIKSYPYPAKLSSLQASIGISQINSLSRNLENRKKIANYYNEILGLYTECYMKRDQNVFLRYSFLVKNRDKWEDKFSGKIDLSIWFKTIASGKTKDFDDINYVVGSNEVSEYVCDHIFNLPTHNKIQAKRLEKLLLELKESGDIITMEKNL